MKNMVMMKPKALLLRFLSTESTRPHPAGPTPVNPAQLVRVCTILYQQQNSPESRLHSSLRAAEFELSHELFLQVCNKFPLSWRPVYLFFGYTLTRPDFTHSSVSLNKMAHVIGKSRNIDLFWEVLHEIGRRRLANHATFKIALTTLARARELNKCLEFFHAMDARYGVAYSSETLNKVVESLCSAKLVGEARFLVSKLREWIKPDAVTYAILVRGFCSVGDLVEASKVWNSMVEQGLEPGLVAGEPMTEALFKVNKDDEALKVFQAMTRKGSPEYKVVIEWLCKRGKVDQACHMFDEMRERGISPDWPTLGSLVYGLVSRGRVREGYELAEWAGPADLSVQHGLMKGLLRLRRAGEATQVFREMIRRRCEPTMHTYVMLLQGHLGKRGRRGPDPLVNFDSIFVGGLVKAGKSLEASKYVERTVKRGLEVPRFDYNRFLHYYSNEDGVVMFEEVGKRLREVGLLDLADIFQRYGQKMATRDRRRRSSHSDSETQNNMTITTGD